MNNPLGGLESISKSTTPSSFPRCSAECCQEAPTDILDEYDRFRRPLNIEYVQQQTIANKKRLEEKDPAVRAESNAALRKTVADRAAHRAYLLRASLIDSVRKRAAAAT